MKKKEPLSPKEENFCRFFVASREPRASAARAGYSVHPERTAMRLLADPEIKRRIAKLENERDAKLAEVTEGYRRLAFGSVADAVKLILSDELTDGSEIEKLDLTMVSDIKRPKGGGLEVKFFDLKLLTSSLVSLNAKSDAKRSLLFLTLINSSVTLTISISSFLSSSMYIPFTDIVSIVYFSEVANGSHIIISTFNPA